MATPDATIPALLDPENLKSEDVKSEDLEDEGQDLHMTTLPTSRTPPIAVTSPHWQSTLESLLRFPGMASNVKLFRPGSPIAEIAFALGVTDSAHTITENDWVTIAERVFEIQTCCLMHAQHIDFDIAADGWVTHEITAEWYARVLRDLQGKGFSTTCTTMVPFVLRVYLQTKSWVKFQRHRGRQRHKQVMDALRPDPSAEIVTRCSSLANGFTHVVRVIRKRRLEQAQQENAYHEVLPYSDDGI
ncbi:hypothetical protein F5883DRAFT_515973 [Diaporthe sp. PMI_573]|nr:hypothetical protein F5883DRAFT_515973 [Diaporthaceae sp. PMI_573]